MFKVKASEMVQNFDECFVQTVCNLNCFTKIWNKNDFYSANIIKQDPNI